MNIQLTDREVLILKTLLDESADVQAKFLERSKNDPEERETRALTRNHMTELDVLIKKLS